EIADLPAIADIGLEAAAVDVVDADQVGEEAAVEAGIFQGARVLGVAVGPEEIAEHRFGMAPATHVAGRGSRLGVCDEMHLTLAHDDRNPSFRPTLKVLFVYERLSIHSSGETCAPGSCHQCARRRGYVEADCVEAVWVGYDTKGDSP